MARIRAEIVRWTREGAPLDAIEKRISGLSVSDDEKSALWLWAWSYRSPHRRRYGENRREVLAD
jgi:hypothetical protein